uniref:Pre-mRNA-processing factor 17 n=1 Tax=Tetradesmus obliquus TaxID=3088 RepID=A0A383WPQ6_TETOB|eukprot:jgi/Sobl393_1/20096/SZX79169.1
MDLLGNYGGSDDEEERPGSPSADAELFKLSLPVQVTAAPNIDTAGRVLMEGKAVTEAETRHYLDPKARSVQYNLPYRDMAAPVVGPAHPFQKDGLAAGLKNHRAGHVEDTHLQSYAFDEQYNTYHSMGYAAAPGSQALVGKTDAAQGGTVYGNAAKRRKTAEEKAAAAERKQRLQQEAQAQVAAGQPFALTNRLPWAEKQAQVPELTEEQRAHIAKAAEAKEATAAEDVEARGPTSFFHGKADKDYQGRSWLAPPRDKKKESDACFLPKRWIHTWSGHTKGVNAIRFFPGAGQLMLSAGLDGKVKIWDALGSYKCMRTYLGHSKGVKDINFTNDGSKFVSVGYDKNIRLWDTETGQVITTLNTGKLYFCGVFHPEDDKQNVLMAGCADKKIYQFDFNTGDVEQEYNYHLGAVNTVTFIDDARRFVSSSDDKSLRVWEFGIPVQIKYIADPSMHSMPAVTPNPAGTAIICQSLDNQIVTYMTKDRFKQNRKKTFKGHNTAGYACQVNFSPDSKYVMSGDFEGRAFFWEWAQPYKVVRTIKAHDGVCIGVAWHPMESSKVATCGWDGLIKYWD